MAANRVRALVSRIFTFAANRRLLPPTANPVIGVKNSTKEKSRDRVLTHEEIRRILDACETQNAYVCAWFRLRLVTAQRGGELLQMRWQDIDAKSHFWSIPGEFVKNAQAASRVPERPRAEDPQDGSAEPLQRVGVSEIADG